IASEVLKPRQVVSEHLLVMEINIEAGEVDVAGTQIFSRRKIRERYQAERRFGLGDANELIDEIFDTLRADEANDVRRNFVHDADRERRRMIAALTCRRSNRVARL